MFAYDFSRYSEIHAYNVQYSSILPPAESPEAYVSGLCLNCVRRRTSDDEDDHDDDIEKICYNSLPKLMPKPFESYEKVYLYVHCT